MNSYRPFIYAAACVFLSVLLSLQSCRKTLTGDARANIITEESSDATLTFYDRIVAMKSSGKYSDTMAAARNGGGVVLSGNSQAERWLYYNWDVTWKGTPMINRGVGGTRWVDMKPYIGLTISDYRPKVIVLYQGENEYSRFPLGDNKNVASTIQPRFLEFYDEVRKQNPRSHIIILSMITSPIMVRKGYAADIAVLNTMYDEKVRRDSAAGNKATFINVSASYPPDQMQLFRTDSLHLNTYVLMTNIVKPIVIAALNAADSSVAPAPDTTVTVPKRPVMFIGATAVANWNIDQSFPELNNNWKKAAYPNLRFSEIYNALGDTVARVMPRQVVINGGEVDVLNKVPLSTMQSWLQRICKEKIWVYDSTIKVTFMYTKPSAPTKNVIYPSNENGWLIIRYFNRNVTNWLNNNYKSRVTPPADTYSSNVNASGALINEHYTSISELEWNVRGYDVNDEKVRAVLIP